MAETMTIVDLGLRYFACTPTQAAKLMTVLASFQEVEREAHGSPWHLTGNGGSEAIASLRIASGRVLPKPVMPKQRPRDQLLLTHAPLAIGHERS